MIESSSCRCTATFDWRKAGNTEVCMAKSSDVAAYARRFSKGHLSFLRPGSEEKWYGTHIHKPNGSWPDVADLMMINLRESAHPLFRGTSALFRGALKSKGGGKLSTHYNGDPATAELLFRIIISVCQLSIYGAVADLMGPVLEFKVTNFLERCGIEVKIDSVQHDGTQSWIVISRGINKYVTELPEEIKKLIHYKEVASNAGKSRCDKTSGTIHAIFIFIFVDCHVDKSTEWE